MIAGRPCRRDRTSELRGELRDDLVRAMQRVPELAGRDADAHRADRRHHEPQLPRGGRRRPATLRHPARRQRHAPARHQPRGRARRDRRRGRRRRRSGGHRLHPARGLSRDPVHRGLAGQRCGVRQPDDARASRRRRSVGSTTARRSRACSSRCGSSRHTGRWPLHAASGSRRSTSSRRDRPPHRACLPRRPDRARALPQRPAQRELHRRRARGSGSSTGNTPGWATPSSTSATSASTTS